MNPIGWRELCSSGFVFFTSTPAQQNNCILKVCWETDDVCVAWLAFFFNILSHVSLSLSTFFAPIIWHSTSIGGIFPRVGRVFPCVQRVFPRIGRMFSCLETVFLYTRRHCWIIWLMVGCSYLYCAQWHNVPSRSCMSPKQWWSFPKLYVAFAVNCCNYF